MIVVLRAKSPARKGYVTYQEIDRRCKYNKYFNNSLTNLGDNYDCNVRNVWMGVNTPYCVNNVPVIAELFGVYTVYYTQAKHATTDHCQLRLPQYFYFPLHKQRALIECPLPCCRKRIKLSQSALWILHVEGKWRRNMRRKTTIFLATCRLHSLQWYTLDWVLNVVAQFVTVISGGGWFLKL